MEPTLTQKPQVKELLDELDALVPGFEKKEQGKTHELTYPNLVELAHVLCPDINPDKYKRRELALKLGEAADFSLDRKATKYCYTQDDFIKLVEAVRKKQGVEA